MLRRGLTLVAVCSLLMLGGCRTAPVMNVTDAPIVTVRSAQQVEQAIVSAGNSLGWRMQPQGPGKMQGTLILRDHRAIVDIEYTSKAYSIKYKESSPSLHYDGTSIHKNYNGWIEHLDRGIRDRLAS